MSSPYWPSTGTVAQWLEWYGIDLSDILGWGALYWDGSGSVNQADIYTSVTTPWSTLVSDPETLPETDLQGYLVFFRKWQGLYTIWFDGYDTYYLVGKTNPVSGSLLSDQKWLQIQARTRNAYQHRGLWASGFTDWLNEVPE